jgi:D-mannonate dehydratase
VNPLASWLAWCWPFKPLGDWYDSLGQFPGAPRCKGERRGKTCGRYLETSREFAPVPLCNRCYNYSPSEAYARFPEEYARMLEEKALTMDAEYEAEVREAAADISKRRKALRAEAWHLNMRALELIQSGRPGLEAEAEAEAMEERAKKLLDEANKLEADENNALNAMRSLRKGAGP